jgi:hypothetical protein
MTRITELYDLWFKCWSTSYIPMLMDRQKWSEEEKNLEPNDVVYFKLEDSQLTGFATWRIGKVESVKMGKDNKVREVVVAYKIISKEEASWRHNTVVRPVRECVKLFEIDETTLAEELEKVRELAEQILSTKVDVTEKKEVVKKKRKTEIEKLKVDSRQFEDVGDLAGELRNKKSRLNYGQFSACYHIEEWNSVGEDLVELSSGPGDQGFQAVVGEEMGDEVTSGDIPTDVLFLI